AKSLSFVAILGLALMSTMVLPQAMAATYWWDAGQAFTNTSASELSSFANVPAEPTGLAKSDITGLWIGGWSQSSSILNQPEIRPVGSNYWAGYLEVYNGTSDADAESTVITNVQLSPTDTVRYDVYLSSGSSCQTVKNASTGATATHCFSAHNYGTTFSSADATLEGHEWTSSDYTSMDGTITFTTFNQYVSGVSSSPSFSTTTVNSPPNCMGGSGGSGTVSLTLNGC
ncbi:MAG: hypothetical protein ACREBJ_00555, partial [Nitrosotalea sp.]